METEKKRALGYLRNSKNKKRTWIETGIKESVVHS